MGDRFNELSEELARLFRKRARRFKRASFFVKLMLLAVGSAIVSMMQFAQLPAGGTFTGVQVAGISASLVVFAGAVFTLVTEDDASEELQSAREAVETVREMKQYLDEFGEFDRMIERAIQLYQSAMVLRGVAERAGVSNAPLDAVLTSFMDTTRRTLPIAMGFDLADIWTICIYQAEPDSENRRDQLRCVAHNRAIECSIDEARIWTEGIGVSGISYANRREIIVPDLQALNLGSMFNLAAGSRTYDEDRYRSIVCVPINVDGRPKPWGVVVATSDRVNHFSLDEEDGLRTAEPVRLLASMTALAVVLCGDDAAAAVSQTAAAPIQPTLTEGVRDA